MKGSTPQTVWTWRWLWRPWEVCTETQRFFLLRFFAALPCFSHVLFLTRLVGIHSQQDLHEFLREAEIMQNFDHENVVRLLGKIWKLQRHVPEEMFRTPPVCCLQYAIISCMMVTYLALTGSGFCWLSVFLPHVCLIAMFFKEQFGHISISYQVSGNKLSV